jgi:hypothetical protein
VVEFQNILLAMGYQVNIREPRGDDIQAACGQLRTEFVLGGARAADAETRSPAEAAVSS